MGFGSVLAAAQRIKLRRVKEILESWSRQTNGLAAATSTSRSLLDNEVEVGANQEYIQTIITPAVMGIVIGALVLLSFILFFIISACCKMCSSKRGCCQRAKDTKYWKRLPYILLVAVGAVLGLAGGAMVIAKGSELATNVRELADMLLVLIDGTIADMREAVRLANLALDATGGDTSDIQEIETVLADVEEIREGDITDVDNQLNTVLAAVRSVSGGVGAVLLVLAIIGLAGATLLQNWIHCIFLFVAFLITWAAWVLFGVFATVKLLVTDLCAETERALLNPTGDVPAICPDAAEAAAAVNSVISDMHNTIATANADTTDANIAMADLYTTLSAQCASFSVAASSSMTTIHDVLCHSDSPDAKLLSAIFQCVTEGDTTYNVAQDTDPVTPTNTCTWSSSFYPGVDFSGGVSPGVNCFRAATEMILDAPDYRGLAEASAREHTATPFAGASSISEQFIEDELTNLSHACAVDGTTVSIAFPAFEEIPLLCYPYVPAGTFWTEATAETCAAQPGSPVLLEDAPAAYEPFTCTAADGVLVPGDADASMAACALIGKPIPEATYQELLGGIEAAGYFKQIIPIINRQMMCEGVVTFSVYLVHEACPKLIGSIGGLSNGFLLAALGHTITAFILCACWRKLVKASKKVQPQDVPLGKIEDAKYPPMQPIPAQPLPAAL